MKIYTGPLLWLIVVFTIAVASASSMAEQKSPNFLILLGDDIDRDSLGPWGGQAQTPHLDKLAAEGIRFNRAYANVAMCAPFRQEFYSGRTVWRTGSMPNHSHSSKDTRSLPHYLKPLGYRVALIGKTHFGPKQAYPFQLLGGLNKKEDPNPTVLKRTRNFLQASREVGVPFCLVVASNDAHAPYTTGNTTLYDADQLKLPEDAIDTPAYREELAKHLAEISNLDALLGDLRALLEEENLADNTMVLYCSEQGSGFPFAKWTCFDDGLASGVVAALPGIIPEGVASDRIMWIADIAPTLLEAAGGEVQPENFDGKSQWANFKGANQEIHPYAYGAFTNCNILDNRDRIFPIRSIRDERFSLIWSPRADEEISSNVTLTQALRMVGSEEGPSKQLDAAASWVAKAKESEDPELHKIVKRFFHRPEWALYDRNSDPEELVNLIDDPEHKEIAEELKKELLHWLDRWGDSDPVATERGFLKAH